MGQAVHKAIKEEEHIQFALKGVETQDRDLFIQTLAQKNLNEYAVYNLGIIHSESRPRNALVTPSPEEIMQAEIIHSTTYYIRDRRQNSSYYAVTVSQSHWPDSDATPTSSIKKLEYNTTLLRKETKSDIENIRKHIADLGKQFAQITGHPDLTTQLLPFAEKYPLEKVKGFSNYNVLKTSVVGITASLDVNMTDGTTQTVKLDLGTPSLNFGWNIRIIE